jgi:hypothetical protein
MDDGQLNALVLMMESHCEANGSIGPREYDAMLLSLNIVDHVPALTDPARRGHIALRNNHRKRVMRVLKAKGLCLSSTMPGIYKILPLRLGMTKRLQNLPSDQERLGMERVTAYMRVVMDELRIVMEFASEHASRLTPAQLEVVMNHLEGSVHRSAEEIRSTINMVLATTDLPTIN